MKINAPINENSNLKELIVNGADEFYLGYLLKNNYFLESILSRHTGKMANFRSLNRLVYMPEFPSRNSFK